MELLDEVENGSTTAARDKDAGYAHRSSYANQPVFGRALNTTFLLTSMPVGGAETLLVNLMRGFDRTRIQPSVVCLKERGPLGEEISQEFPLVENLIRNKVDVGVLLRLRSVFKRWKTDAVVTVGAGDKMFWGRIAARLAGVRVVCSALHSTGWPDGVGRLNRLLTPITDAFIGVAGSHGDFLVDFERFPRRKVKVIRNGIDTDRFIPNEAAYREVREELGLPHSSKLVGIVAALRPEKNHTLFLELAKRIHQTRHEDLSDIHFLIIGDGAERPKIESLISEHGLGDVVHMLGSRSDTPRLFAALNAFLLTSHNEASPVSILEALSCEVPVVSSRVGSVSETVRDGWNGFTATPGDAVDFEEKLVSILSSEEMATTMGSNGRRFVMENASLRSMVERYEELIHRIWRS